MAKTKGKEVTLTPAKSNVDSGARSGMLADGGAATGQGKKKASGGTSSGSGGNRGKKSAKSVSALGADGASDGAAGTKGANQSNRPRCEGSEPVDVITGEVIEHQEDVLLPGFPELSFFRHHSSGWAGERLPFGRGGCTHNYHQYIEERDGAFWLREADGRWGNLGAIADGETVRLRGKRYAITRQGERFDVESLETGWNRRFEPAKPGARAILRSVVNRRGRGVYLQYESPAPAIPRLLRIATTTGAEIALTYDEEGRIIRSVAVASGCEHSACDYAYHEAGELAAVRDACGLQNRFWYDGQHRQVKSQLPLGDLFYYKYDEQGECIKSWGERRLHHWEYDRSTPGEVVVTGVEMARVFRAGPNGELLEERSFDERWANYYEYDDDLLLIAHTNAAGERREYTYDSWGAKIRETDPNGNVTSWLRFGDREIEYRPDGTSIERRFDEHGHLVHVRWSDGDERRYERNQFGSIEFVYGPDGMLEERKYDHFSNVIWTRDARGLETYYTYDARHHLTQKQDSLGRTWRYSHDPYGRQLWEQHPDGTVRQYGHTVFGKVNHIIDELGRETRIEHAGTGKVARRILSDGRSYQLDRNTNELLTKQTNPRYEEYRFDYDFADQLIGEETYDGRAYEYLRDLGGRVHRVERPDRTFREYEYDDNGNIIREGSTHGARYYERNAVGLQYQAAADDGAEVFLINFERDRQGRVIGEIQNGHELSWEYDHCGRVKARTVCGERTEYQYNAAGDLIGVIHEGRQLTVHRDAAGREVRLQLENPTHQPTAIDSLWDHRGRLSDRRVVAPGPSDPQLAKRFPSPPRALDAGTLTPTPAGDGLPAGWRVVSQRKWQWDAASRLLQLDDRTWGSSNFGYDPVTDHLTSAQRGSFGEIFHYDATGSLDAALRTQAGNPVNATEKLPKPAASYQQSARLAATLAWNTPPSAGLAMPHAALALGAPTRLESKRGNVLTQHGANDYQTDSMNRRTVRRNRKTGEETRYTWDCRDQLREVQRPDGWRIRFFYDAFGRRVRKDVQPGPEPADIAEKRARVELLRASLEAGKLKDEEANALKEEEATLPPREEGYSVTYLWDDDELCAELFHDGSFRVHIHERGTHRPLLQSDGHELFLVVTDHLGTPKELIDANGDVAWSVAHGAWGNIIEEWRYPNRLENNYNDDSHLIRSILREPEEPKHPNLPRHPPESPFRLLGQWYDEETGLCATRFRLFDPETACWLSPDPLLLDGGENAFGFDGAPTMVADPLGLSKDCDQTKNGGGDGEGGRKTSEQEAQEDGKKQQQRQDESDDAVQQKTHDRTEDERSQALKDEVHEKTAELHRKLYGQDRKNENMVAGARIKGTDKTFVRTNKDAARADPEDLNPVMRKRVEAQDKVIDTEKRLYKGDEENGVKPKTTDEIQKMSDEELEAELAKDGVPRDVEGMDTVDTLRGVNNRTRFREEPERKRAAQEGREPEKLRDEVFDDMKEKENGKHGEVLATSDALNEIEKTEGRDATPADLENIELHNERLPAKRSHEHKPHGFGRCNCCQSNTKGVQPTPEVQEDEQFTSERDASRWEE